MGVIHSGLASSAQADDGQRIWQPPAARLEHVVHALSSDPGDQCHWRLSNGLQANSTFTGLVSGILARPNMTSPHRPTTVWTKLLHNPIDGPGLRPRKRAKTLFTSGMELVDPGACFRTRVGRRKTCSEVYTLGFVFVQKFGNGSP